MRGLGMINGSAEYTDPDFCQSSQPAARISTRSSHAVQQGADGNRSVERMRTGDMYFSECG
jgi:hypothetical protein